jgi:hypothetical protein
MLRRLLNIASDVCLVACVTLMGMWVRSYSQLDNILISPAPQSYLFVSGNGKLYFCGWLTTRTIRELFIWKSMPFPLAGPRTDLLNVAFTFFPFGVVLTMPY